MKKKVKLHDKEFVLYIGKKEIDRINKELAKKINKDYEGKKPIVLSILNGSFIFAADLVRYFDFPIKMEFVRYSSYEGTESTGVIKQILGMKSDIRDQDLLIIEDIVDTGNTLSKALVELRSHGPSSVKVVSLLLKPDALKHVIPIDYVGKEIPNDFVVGYGLDYDELGRDLPAIYKLKE
jgi:hypoxanthine phosphoribosyltransferase